MRLAMILPNAQDGTSFYRAAMPMAMLARQHPELKLIHGGGDGTEWSWDRLAECDAAFIQRPFNPVHLQVVSMCKRLRIPVWIDYDDDMAAVPVSHPSYETMSSPMVASNIGDCARMADVVTVSTPAIGKQLNCDNMVLIPNGLDNYHVRYSNTRRRKVISWRGSVIHQEDLLTVIGNINEIAVAHPDWHWRFIGDAPWDIHHAIPAAQLTVGPKFSVQDPLAWLESYYEAAPYIHIAPLADNQFNRSKSNCVWLESAAAGAMLIAPDFSDEFRQAGIRNYSSGSTFMMAIESAMGQYDDGKIHPNVALSRKEIERRGLLLSETNKARWKIVKTLCQHPTTVML